MATAAEANRPSICRGDGGRLELIHTSHAPLVGKRRPRELAGWPRHAMSTTTCATWFWANQHDPRLLNQQTAERAR